MVRITKTEIFIKVVYYGPGLSGKTTNLEVIHKQLPTGKKGDLTSIATEQDRTIFFDCLPFEAPSPDGRVLKLQLFTIPGQVYYRSTRQLILRGADGTVFVADSQREKRRENLESFQDLCEILYAYRVDVKKMPLVIQYNKRDLPNLIPLDEMEGGLNKIKRPSFCASAIQRVGIMETLRRVLLIIMERLKLLPHEIRDEARLEDRRKALVQKALSANLSQTEWLEFTGLHLDVRRRGPVGPLMSDLKLVLQKQAEFKNQEQAMSLCETILSVDPGEHDIRKALEVFQRTLDGPAQTHSPPPPQLKPRVFSANLEYPHPPPPTAEKTNIPPNILRLQEEVRLNPEDLFARKKLLNLYLKNKMKEQAATELLTTSRIHFKNGKYELAKKCIQYLLKLDPHHENGLAFLRILS